jgi:hypothetical protein
VSISANETAPFVKVVKEIDDVLQKVSKHEMKKTGKVVIKIWPKVGGGSAERVL